MKLPSYYSYYSYRRRDHVMLPRTVRKCRSKQSAIASLSTSLLSSQFSAAEDREAVGGEDRNGSKVST